VRVYNQNQTRASFCMRAELTVRDRRSFGGGYSLLEVLLVITVGMIFCGMGVVGSRGLSGPNRLVQSANQVLSLVEHVRAEAIVAGQPRALILRMDGEEPQRLWSIGQIQNGAVQVMGRWQELPESVMVETVFSTARYPNALAPEEGVIREGVLATGEVVRSLVFDAYGALGASEGSLEDMVPYLNTDVEESQGCYLYLRRAKRDPMGAWSPVLSEEAGLAEARLLYISPLTGKVSHISYR